MTSKIKKLPPHIVHQIAAGEVIERPASAIKELIENAIDAGASKIEVEIRGGGLELLSVTDDGGGLNEVDLPLAFEAHATSKLEKIEDFGSLRTMGFRGEALASLQSIADVVIRSGDSTTHNSAEIRSHYGHVSKVIPIDRRVGTKVVVKGLFAQTPARLKFMKSPRGESQAVQNVLKRYALVYPRIHFSFLDLDSDRQWQVTRTNSKERALWYFSSDDESQWFEASDELAGWRVDIVALFPRYQGRVKSGVQLILNDRPIKDHRLEFAVRRGYEGYTEFPREVSAVIRLTGDPKTFDVNVHPTKSEVRFSNPEPIFALIVNVLRGALEKSHHQKEIKFGDSVPGPMPTGARSKSLSLSSGSNSGDIVLPEAEKFVSQVSFVAEVPTFEYLGDLDQTYLLCRRQSELFIFDQHALHERVLYEKLLSSWSADGKLASQRLLFPQPVLLEGAEVLMEQEELLQRLGFELRLWNDSKIQIVAVPSILKRDYSRVLAKLVESTERADEALLKDILASMACHSAVRAHDRLNPAEIVQLLNDFGTKDALGHCPHGRPTFVRFQLADLEKIFHRIL